MAGLFSRLFGKKVPAPPIPEHPAPVTSPSIPRRIPELLKFVPVSDIALDVGADPLRPSWLDLSLDTSIISPPVAPADFGDFTVIDVETTGFDPVCHDVIEVTALRFESFKPSALFTSLVKPRHNMHIPSSASEVNMISDSDVENAPYFSEICASLQRFLNPAKIIVGHNLPFDVKFLFISGIHWDSSKLYVDTLENSRRFLGSKRYFVPTRLSSFRLEDMCRYYEIPFSDAHFSASDCYATGCVFQRLLDDMAVYVPRNDSPARKPPIAGVDYEPAAYISVRSIQPRKPLNPKSPLYQKKIVFTGELSIPRVDAMQMAADAGMKLMSSVTKKTDYLVLGTYLNPDYLSSKHRKADELNANGEGHIVFLSEAEFMELVKDESI